MEIKRFIDFVSAVIGLMVFCPLMIVIALLIRVKLGKPSLFIQTRPGLKGQPFELYKFKTMIDCRDGKGMLLHDVDRLTSFGKFLRSTSIDELLELWNVMKGDMSLVGPRPLLMQYLDRYTPEQARRHDVRPGMTGWAQVNGRNSLSWEEKFKLDVWYVDNWSLWLDIKILLMTFKKVFIREGINAEGEATMQEFLGHAMTQRR
jgi:lipopolysaccharide/colanic/teichoic acid biosynthesis glycosyltransferase